MPPAINPSKGTGAGAASLPEACFIQTNQRMLLRTKPRSAQEIWQGRGGIGCAFSTLFQPGRLDVSALRDPGHVEPSPLGGAGPGRYSDPGLIGGLSWTEPVPEATGATFTPFLHTHLEISRRKGAFLKTVSVTLKENLNLWFPYLPHPVL